MCLVLEHSGEGTLLVSTLRELQVWWSERHQPGVLQMTFSSKVMRVIKEKESRSHSPEGGGIGAGA